MLHCIMGLNIEGFEWVYCKHRVIPSHALTHSMTYACKGFRVCLYIAACKTYA